MPSKSQIAQSVRRAALLLMVSIFISRVIGFFREWILARTVGANAMTDVYYASFTIPDYLNHLMASGALSISFIPILGEYHVSCREDLGKALFRALGTIFASVLIILIIAAEIYARELGELIAPGFTPAQLDQLAVLLRIILPAQLFFYWGGLSTSVQHFHGRFWLPAISPIIYNLSIIGFGVGLHRQLGVAGFSWGVLVGSFVGHGCLQAIGTIRCGYRLAPLFSFGHEVRSGLRKYFWLSLPIMMGFSLVITDEWIAKYLASSLEPKILSWLSYARTEMRIPVAIVGQAAGIASFPYLARLWSEQHFDDYGNAVLTEIEKQWAIGTVSAVILYECALPITTFIYGGGKLLASDLIAISRALEIYAIGVFFWTAQVLFSRAFYAAQRTWVPSLIGTMLSFLCLPFYAVLTRKLGYLGIAWAGTIGIIAYCAVLWVLLRAHLKRHSAGLNYSKFYLFTGSWLLVVGVIWVICEMTTRLGLYEGTPLSGLIHVSLILLVSIPLCWIMLRTVFRPMTDEPLF